MPKISKQFSITISICLAVLLFLTCIAGAFIMPTLSDLLINTKDNIGNRDNITALGRAFVLALAYLILADVLFADVLLFILLLRVRKGLVFTKKSTELIRDISWCCIGLMLFFALLGIYFQLSFIVAFAAMFLGLCLRVVKNVLEEASDIKSENDLTV